MGLEELCNYTILWAVVIIAFGVPVLILAYRKYVKEQKAKVRQGSNGERYIAKLLQELPEGYRCLHDLLLKYEGYTVQIDHVVISEYGVIVIETKNFRGMIYGSGENKRWTQVNKGKKRRFYSPTIQNNRHRFVISRICKLPIEKVIPITVFVGKCELHLEDVGRIILSKDLLPYIYGITEKILSQSDVERIFKRLESKNITSESTRRHHVAYVKRVKSKN